MQSSRRRFVGAAAASLLAGRSWAACAPASRMQTDQALRRLEDLPLDRSPSWGARGALTVARSSTDVGGNPVRVMSYGGGFPGPVLRLRPGETLNLKFDNRLDEATNLHFHGLYVSPSGRADNIWVVAPPGAGFEYELQVAAQEAGVHWIHPHVHGHTAKQLFAGLAMPVVVQGEIDRDSELAQAEDHVLVLKDLSIANCAVAAHAPNDWIFGKEGEWLLVNGQVRPVLHAGKSLLRLRLVNASNSRFWRIALDSGEALHLIALDGRFLESRVEVGELLLVPAARAEVLVVLPDRRPRRLLYRNYPRVGRNATAEQPILTLLPPASSQQVALPGRLMTLQRFDERLADAHREVRFSPMLINGKPFHHHHQGGHVAPTFEVRAGAREIWTVHNDDVMNHPFHLHTWHFDLLSVNGRPPAITAIRDMLNLSPGDAARIGIHFADFSGRTMFHCHIAEHADRGMMAVLDVR
ncbi:MAG TPA: multicopper oxidase family protein [Burkholderiales bacterium]|nr:multicopper oxidase family protein [Burkholderiales bacterium]